MAKTPVSRNAPPPAPEDVLEEESVEAAPVTEPAPTPAPTPDPQKAAVDAGPVAFNAKQPFGMVYDEKGFKQFLQGGNMYNRVTKEFIRKVGNPDG